MSKVLVTGGSGFIGKATCSALQANGDSPIVLDVSMGFDVKTEQAFEFALDAKPDAIIHLAGVLGTAELFDDPFMAVEVNVNGTLRMLKVCEQLQIPYVGITMPQVWDNVYQATKLAGLKLAHAWHRHFDVPVSHVRAFNAFGEGQKVHGVQKIVPTFATLAWEGKPLPIWGDGNQICDLVYVHDVAKMLVDALNFGGMQIFDAGTGIPHTVNEVATMVNAFTGNVAPNNYLPLRKGEHGDGVLAEGEGWNELGWVPQFKLDEFKRVVEWYRPQVGRVLR